MQKHLFGNYLLQYNNNAHFKICIEFHDIPHLTDESNKGSVYSANYQLFTAPIVNTTTTNRIAFVMSTTVVYATSRLFFDRHGTAFGKRMT